MAIMTQWNETNDWNEVVFAANTAGCVSKTVPPIRQ